LFSGKGAKVLLFGIAAAIGNNFGFLQACLVLENSVAAVVVTG